GVRAGILMAPLLPGLSALPDQIEQTVRAAADHGAAFIGSNVLNLKPGVKEHFLGFLDEQYPELLERYRDLYGLKYAPKRYTERVGERVREAKAAIGYGEDHHRYVETPPEPLQLALPF